ncbi:MAG: glycosyltransferase [Planctomycetes bacterium]|nr:glycosyltransferase [Planctomycetota bacterium]
MRVLLIAHGFPPDSVGGVEQHVHGLAHALAAAGHDVHVLARASLPLLDQGVFLPGPHGNPQVTRYAFRWHGVDSLDTLYTCPPMAAALATWLQARTAAGERFDLAHLHHLTGVTSDAPAVLQAAGIPVVLTLHDYWLLCPRGQMWHRREEVCDRADPDRCSPCIEATFTGLVVPGAGAGATARLHARSRAALAQVDRFVIPSARAIPPYAAFGLDPTRITVVGNGVDTERLATLPPPTFAGPLRVGYLGTLIPSKGLHVLLAALRRLPPGTASLDIHGNTVPYHGDEGYLTRCFAPLRAGDPVRYHGPYVAADLPRILAALDVVAAPALWQEAFGLTVREALAAGRPVLVSRIGGLQDAVTDGTEGLVLPPGDVDAWAAAIATLAGNPDRLRAMAASSRPRARGFAELASDVARIYADLLSARRRSGDTAWRRA